MTNSPESPTPQKPRFERILELIQKTPTDKLLRMLGELNAPEYQIELELLLRPLGLASAEQNTAVQVTIVADPKGLMIYYEFPTQSGDLHNWVFTYRDKGSFEATIKAVFNKNSGDILHVQQLQQLLEAHSISSGNSVEAPSKPHYLSQNLFQINVPMALGNGFLDIIEETTAQTKVCMQIVFKRTETARLVEVTITDASTKAILLSQRLITSSQENWDAAVLAVQEFIENRNQTDNGSTADQAYFILADNGFVFKMSRN